MESRATGCARTSPKLPHRACARLRDKHGAIAAALPRPEIVLRKCRRVFLSLLRFHGCQRYVHMIGRCFPALVADLTARCWRTAFHVVDDIQVAVRPVVVAKAKVRAHGWALTCHLHEAVNVRKRLNDSFLQAARTNGKIPLGKGRRNVPRLRAAIEISLWTVVGSDAKLVRVPP